VSNLYNYYSPESGTSRQELLHILALETGSGDLSLSNFQGLKGGDQHSPLTEEDILNKPFYTVAEAEGTEHQKIESSRLKDYRLGEGAEFPWFLIYSPFSSTCALSGSERFNNCHISHTSTECI
jgi:hypothetical protein